MKRILHLADIHFHHSTLDDLVEPCRRVIDIAKGLAGNLTDPQLDAIVIAGDLTTDRGLIDNATAVAARSFVVRLSKWAPVYIVAGNHDLTFKEGVPNNLRAILADDRGSIVSRVFVIDRPEIVRRDGYTLSFLPYPSPATFHAVTGESDLGLISDRLVEVARGLYVQASEHGGCPLAVFHGTVQGGRHGDESSPSLSTRGQDIVLPTNALSGFKGTLCGHLHHPQTIQTPDGLAMYPGCVTPLTFGERNIEPGVLVWTIEGDDVTHIDRIVLPVSHQRLQVEVGAEDWDEGVDARFNLTQWITSVVSPGARVKVKATLGRQRLGLFTPEILEAVRDEFRLDSLVMDKTEIPEHRQWFQQDADRAARVDLIEALKTYADYSGDPAYRSNLEQIVKIGHEVEELVDHLSEDPRYDFTPLELQLTNYKQFADVAVDFSDLPARSGILGPTGIGKSNLILAWAALLYGGNPKSEEGKAKTSLGDMVRRGERSCRLRGVFSSGGGLYRVTRDITVDGKGRGSTRLFFEQGYHPGQHCDPEWIALNEGNARQTQQEIERRVGPESLHWITRHLRQHGRSAVKMGPSELADAINSTLQLDFEARQQHAKQIVTTAESAKQAAINRREVLSSHLPDESTLDQQEAVAQEKRTEAARRGMDAQKEVDEASVLVESSSVEVGRIQAQLDRVASAQAKRGQVESDLSKIDTLCNAVRRELDSLEGAPDLAELEATADQARGVSDRAAARLSDLKDEHNARLVEEAGALGALGQAAQAAALRRTEAHARMQAAKRRVDELGRSAALVSQVPCRGERWVDPVEGEMDGTLCPLLQEAHKSAEGLPDAVEKAEIAEANYTNADEDYQVARDHHEAYKLECATDAHTRSEAITEAREEAEKASRLSDRATAELTKWKKAAERVRDLRAQSEVLQGKRRDLSAQLLEIQEDAEKAASLQAQLDGVTKSLADHRARLSKAQRDLNEARETCVRCDSQLGQIADMRQQRADTLAQIQTLRDEERRQELRRLAASYYLEAVQRTGIPSLLLDQLAPQLERRVNDLLAPAGRQLRIETTRETTTGKTIASVTLSFRSPTSNDEFVPIAELSGGEEDLANAAWAVGLARVSADMTGTPLGLLVLDEPFTGVSAEYEDAVREVLGSIQEHVSRVLIITHRRDLMPMFDSSMVLSANGVGTFVGVE